MKQEKMAPPAFYLLLFWIAVLWTSGDATAGYRVLDIRHWAAPDHTRVVLDLDGPVAHNIAPSENPLTLVVNLAGISLGKRKQEISLKDQVIRKLAVNAAGEEQAEITFFLHKPGRWKVFSLKPFQDKPHRLVVDVFRTDLEEMEKTERKVSEALKAKKKKIVVLDPGHGGEDPGAIGPRGTKEKDIVLALARRLQKTLDESEEVRSFLTRRGDYFVPLNDRIRIAGEYGADLLISLHTNGSNSRHIRGTSVFCLSLKGASDKASQLLAQKENASDMMGGISLVPGKRDLDTILMDLEMTHTINESLQLGGMVLSELKRINRIQFSQPRQAAFAVLKAPSFPSVLVETAYITHPLEEKSLRQSSFQSDVSRAIVGAVKKFIPVLAIKEEATPAAGGGERG
jgi:N-acetylmuramoyl-L-alanine amidase